MKRWLRIFVGLSLIDLFVWWLKWLVVPPAERRTRTFWWPWFVFQVIGGYPPGELDSESWGAYPDWLRKHEPWLAPFLHTRNNYEDLVALREWWGPDYEESIPWDRLLRMARGRPSESAAEDPSE